MIKVRHGFAALAALGLLTACGGGDEQEPGGVTPEESAALNNAAEMLDASPDSLTAPEDMPLDDVLNEGSEANAS
jgi:hypothetical protein